MWPDTNRHIFIQRKIITLTINDKIFFKEKGDGNPV